MAADRDRGMFERQVLAHLNGLYGVALRLTRNPEDAEDLVAETVTRAWSGIHSLSDEASFRPWIFRILHNSFVSECRKRAARPRTETLEEEPEDDKEPCRFSLFEKLHRPFLMWWGNPEQEFLNKLLREEIERALDILPEQYRVVVVLAEVEGLTYPEIAEALGVPVGTVRSRLARGRCLLQKMLWQQAKDRGIGTGPGGEDEKAVSPGSTPGQAPQSVKDSSEKRESHERTQNP